MKGVPFVLQAPQADLTKDLPLVVDHLLGNAQKPVDRGGIFGRLKSLFS